MAQPQLEAQQQTLTHDQLVPIDDRVKIGETNYLLIPTKFTCNNMIIIELLKNHPIFPALTLTASVPTIYIYQFWHTVHYDIPTKSMRCTIDQQEVDVNLDLFRSVLHLPNKTDKHHILFDPVPELQETVSFLRDLGYDESEKAFSVISDFKRKNLPQPWQTLLTILNRCTTGKETGTDSARLLTLQMLYGVVYVRHIDYAELIWEELRDNISSKEKKKEKIPFVRYIKLLIQNWMYKFVNIARRVDEPQHTKDDIVNRVKADASITKNAGMPIPDVLLNLANKESDIYKKYMGVDVPINQPKPAASSSGTYKKPRATGDRKKRMLKKEMSKCKTAINKEFVGVVAPMVEPELCGPSHRAHRKSRANLGESLKVKIGVRRVQDEGEDDDLDKDMDEIVQKGVEHFEGGETEHFNEDNGGEEMDEELTISNGQDNDDDDDVDDDHNGVGGTRLEPRWKKKSHTVSVESVPSADPWARLVKLGQLVYSRPLEPTKPPSSHSRPSLQGLVSQSLGRNGERAEDEDTRSRSLLSSPRSLSIEYMRSLNETPTYEGLDRMTRATSSQEASRGPVGKPPVLNVTAAMSGGHNVGFSKNVQTEPPSGSVATEHPPPAQPIFTAATTTMSTPIHVVEGEDLTPVTMSHFNKTIKEVLQQVDSRFQAQRRFQTGKGTEPGCSSASAHRNFTFNELKLMMLAHMLEQPEYRNAEPNLFAILNEFAESDAAKVTRGDTRDVMESINNLSDRLDATTHRFARAVETLSDRVSFLEQTCKPQALRKRPHDDPEGDDHEGASSKRLRTTESTTSATPTKTTTTTTQQLPSTSGRQQQSQEPQR